jgi:hypothetical protein
VGKKGDLHSLKLYNMSVSGLCVYALNINQEINVIIADKFNSVRINCVSINFVTLTSINFVALIRINLVSPKKNDNTKTTSPIPRFDTLWR